MKPRRANPHPEVGALSGLQHGPKPTSRRQAPPGLPCLGWSLNPSDSLMAQWVKNLPATQETLETLAQPLGWEDPLEKVMAIHNSILAWKIPWTDKPGGLRVVHGVTKSQT